MFFAIEDPSPELPITGPPTGRRDILTNGNKKADSPHPKRNRKEKKRIAWVSFKTHLSRCEKMHAKSCERNRRELPRELNVLVFEQPHHHGHGVQERGRYKHQLQEGGKGINKTKKQTRQK